MLTWTCHRKQRIHDAHNEREESHGWKFGGQCVLTNGGHISESQLRDASNRDLHALVGNVNATIYGVTPRITSNDI
jgi:hypothetical protein